MATLINRFDRNINGEVTFLGNTLGLAKAAGSLSPGTQGSIGAFITMNNRLRAPSGWGTNTTLDYNLNSSPCKLSLPSGSEVVYAELVWSATSRIFNNSIIPSEYVVFIDSLNIPHTVRADQNTSINHQFISGIPRTESQSITGEMYIRSAIVTDLVKRAGEGQYVCSGVNALLEAANDSMQFAGWTLIIVYTNSDLPLRNIKVWISDYDSLEEEQNLNIITPKKGLVKAKMSFVAAEGDAIYNDNNYIKFGDKKVDLSGPNNPTNNFFASQINGDNGELLTFGPYGDNNHNPYTLSNAPGGRQGWDITNINIDNVIECGNSNILWGLGNDNGVFKEQIFVPVIGLRVDLNEPEIITYKNVDKGYANVGDVLTYTFKINNTGEYGIADLEFSSQISEDTSFIEDSISINGNIISEVEPNDIRIKYLEEHNELEISYKVRIDRLPTAKSIETTETLKYKFFLNDNQEYHEKIIDIPTKLQNMSLMPMSMTNTITSTSVNVVDISNTVRSVESYFTNSNTELEYTIKITNNGNTEANSIIYIETLPSAISFKSGSVKVNGISYPSYNPNPPGFTINSPLNINGTSTINFKVITGSDSSPKTISNKATIIYRYTSDPSIPNNAIGSIETNVINYKINDYNITNDAYISYNFIVDPSIVDIRSDSNQTTSTSSQLNRAILDTVKISDKSYTNIGEKIAYTITLKNKGNVSANNVVLIDTIPSEVTFVTNSLILNSVTQTGANLYTAYNIATIPVGTTTISYSVLVNTIPSTNPVNNAISSSYNYTVNPSFPNAYTGGSNFNNVNTQVNTVFFNAKKSVDKAYADKGDTITYTIVFSNTGNTTSNNTTFKDTIPNDTTFITNSLVLNGITQSGLNPNLGINIGTLPVGNSTLTFSVLVNTIPSSNPIANAAVITYNYTVNPSIPNGYSSSANTNIVTTKVNNITLYPTISVNNRYAGIGEELTYTLLINAIGNTDANEVILYNTIPNGTSFVDNSLSVNGILKYGFNPSIGAALGSLSSGISTVTFRVLVQTLPDITPIKDSSRLTYKYTVNPSVINGINKEILSNEASTYINSPIIYTNNNVSTIFANVGTTITYTVSITNSGNVVATNSVFTNTIPEGTSFITNSLTVNSLTQIGANPNTGYNLGTIPIGTTTVSFKVVTNTLPTLNPMPSFANIFYQYTVDPSIPNGASKIVTTDTVKTKVTTSILNQNKIVDKEYCKVGDTLKYTIQLINIGNTTSNEVYLQDAIPEGTTLVADSVVYEGTTLPGVNPTNGIQLGTIPIGQSTLTFRVVVDTIPTVNPIPNASQGNYKYTVDPSVPNGEFRAITSDKITTLVNMVYLSGTRSVDKNYADLGDTLLYNIQLNNTGSTSANNVYIQNTIPNGTEFVTNSLVVNGATINNGNTTLGLNIGTVAVGINTITYSLLVNTVPSPNPITSIGNGRYNYTVNPSKPNEFSDSININSVATSINYVLLNSNKSIDKYFADIGEVLTYTVVLANNGNVSANNVIFKDTVPTGVSYITDSLLLNGVIINGVNPNVGFSIGTIPANALVTVSYQVVVNTIPSINPVINQSITNYDYTVNPSNTNGRSGISASNLVSLKVNTVFMNSKNTVDKQYANVGDTLTYTVELSNTGNVRANNLVLKDTIVNGLSFVEGSVSVLNSGHKIYNSTSAEYLFTVDPAMPNAVSDKGTSNTVSTIITTSYDVTVVSGFLNINLDIIPVGITTLTFKMKADTIPNPNPILSTVITDFNYTVDPSLPNSKSSKSITNAVSSTINTVFMDVNKYVDKDCAKVGDTLIYTIPLINKGNVSANNLVVKDTIPSSTTFITDSLTINGITQNGVTLTPTLSLGTVPVGTTTIAFKVKVDTIPSINAIKNSATVVYNYTVNPSNINQYSVSKSTNIVTNINDVFINSTKSVDKAYGDIGEILTYTMLLVNTGNTIANNVVIKDTLPIGASFISGSVNVMNEYDPIRNEIVAGFSYTVNPDLLVVANAGAISNSTKTLYDNIDGTVVNGALNINIGTIPIGTTTVSFAMAINTLPSPNPILNSAITSYNYTVNPSTPSGESGYTNSNIATTQINTVFLNGNKYANKGFANVGDTLIYTIYLINSGSVAANNVFLKDTIPQGTTFISNTLAVNGVIQNGINPQLGLTIPNINVGVTTVVYSVKVDTIPNINPIGNLAYATYQYTAYPTLPNSKGSTIKISSDNTQINTVFLNSKKFVDKNYADIGDTITYTFGIYNTGNVTANNVVFRDTIPSGTTFKSDTLIFNNITQTGVSPITGFNAGTIPIGTSTISFKVIVDTIPTINPIENKGLISYNYTVDPSIPNGYSSYANTNSVNTTIKTVFLNASTKVNKAFALVNDTLTYTIVLKNTGNIVANNLIIQDTIANELTFINDSVKINGIIKTAVNPHLGFTIETIPIGVTTITFDAMVNTIPSPNPILNIAQYNYKYTVDPSVPLGQSMYGNTNVESTYISKKVINSIKTVDKKYANVGDTITYTIDFINESPVVATNVVFKDTIPGNTTYVKNSLYINGINYVGLTPNIPINLESIPTGTTSVSFKVIVDTIPTINPLQNSAVVTYNYTETPEIVNGASGGAFSNVVTTKVNTVFINSTKSVNKNYADVGEIITYRMLLVNSGNTIANYAILKDTVPNGTSFVQGSVVVNNTSGIADVINGALNIDIGTIPIGTTTVSFDVIVDTIPSINPMLNSAITNYNYTVDPSIPNQYSNYSDTNNVWTKVNSVWLNASKNVNKKYANVGDTLIYTIPMVNTGNVEANNVKFQDTIPIGTSFVTNSLLVNGITQTGINPIIGLQLATIPLGTTTISFNVIVDTIPSINPIENYATMIYDYTVYPTLPNSKRGNIKTNTSTTKINTVFLNSSKKVNKAYADVGETILYTIELNNTGNTTANNVFVIESIPNGLSYVSDSVQSSSASLLGINSIRNSATVQYSYLNGNINPVQVLGGINVNTVTTTVENVLYDNNSNLLSISVGTIPVGITTVTFIALVDTIPSINPAINKALIGYEYTVDPSIPNEYSGTSNTNSVNTKISTVFINAREYVDKNYANIGDVLVYTIPIINTGNVSANNVIVVDTIPEGASFISDSIKINNQVQIGKNLASPLNIDSIPVGTTTLVFKVKVDTIPSVNPIENSMLLTYNYTVDPSIPNSKSGFTNTNIVRTKINSVILNSNNYVDKEYVTIGDTLNYTIPIMNTGNTTANNVVLLDTISNGMSFITDSLTFNGVSYTGANPNLGVNLGTLPIGTTTVSFAVKVETLPSINPVRNSALISYKYTVDPSIPNEYSNFIITTESKTMVNAVLLNSNKTVNKAYAHVGDTITYTIKLINTGNITARNVVIKDTIPLGATYKAESMNIETSGNVINNNVKANYLFIIDPIENINGQNSGISNSAVITYGLGETVTIADNILDIRLGIIPVGITTITFDVNVDTIPSSNPMKNSAYTTFNYTVDPSLVNAYSSQINTNVVSTQINTVFINSNNYVNKKYANVGETLIFTIPISNTGNISANNVVLQSTTPNGTSFITNSLLVNGISIPGVNPNTALSIGTIPIGTITVMYAIKVDTIPSSNPISSSAVITYNYTVNPSLPNSYSNSANTNITNTKVNTVFLNSRKYVNKEYADIGDEIIYTMLLVNTGNTIANNVILKDSIPSEVTYKSGSLVSTTGATGEVLNDVFTVNVGTVPVGTTTLSFTVIVNTIPSVNPILNEAITDFVYTVDPSLPNNNNNIIRSNVVSTKVNSVLLNSINIVDKNFANVGETLIFTIPIDNTGNTSANGAILQSAIPVGTTFVNNSIKLNGVTVVNENPEIGYSIGTIPIGVTTVSYKVVVNTIPSPNPVQSFATITYKYTVSPTIPNEKNNFVTTNRTNTKINTVFLNSRKKVDRNYSDISESVLYTIELYNTGNITANNVVVIESIPTGLRYVSDSVELIGDSTVGANLIANNATLQYTFINDNTNSTKVLGGINSNSVTTGVPSVQYNTSSGLLSIVAGTIPVGTTTINFRAIIDTIPSVNPIINKALIGFYYTVDPSIPNAYSNNSNTNSVTTEVSTVFLNLNKYVNKNYAKIGDTLIYTIPIKNSGNTSANNVKLLDTIPIGTSYINDSFMINGVIKNGANLNGELNIGTIPVGTTTIVFRLNVDTIPSINPIANEAFVSYQYTVVPTIPNDYRGYGKTNIAKTTINAVRIGSSKQIDKKYVDIGDTIVYTIPVVNTGNIEASNVMFIDTISNGMSFVNNSLTVSGVSINGANPNIGVNLGSIPVGTTTIAFAVKVDTLPSSNPVTNVALTTYKYTVDPSIPNEYSGYSITNITENEVKSVLLNSYKSVDKKYANVGDTLKYTIVLDNRGNIQANDILVQDTIVSGLIYKFDSLTVANSSITDVTVTSGIMKLLLNTIPVGITTINFNVLVDTIPSVNPILNSSTTSYKYTVDPSLPKTALGTIYTNVVSTKVNTVFLNSNKFVNKDYAHVGDTLIYTISLINTGNTTANDVRFQDTIPEGTSFVTNSLLVNGVTQNGVNPNVSFNIGTVAVGTTTIEFRVKVNTIPSANPILNSATTIYDYTVDPSIPNANSKAIYTNIVNTKINTVFLNSNKFVDKYYADIGDVLSYTIPIINTGNVSANNVVFQDTIPVGTSFVPNSLILDGVNQMGKDPSIGFNIGTIPVGTTTLSFKVYVDTIPSANPILNAGVIRYDYTVNPNNPNGYSNSANTNIVSTKVNTVFLYMNKSVDKKYAHVGDTLLFTIPIRNTGNTTANDCIFQDDIQTGTTFVTNTLKVNGVTMVGARPDVGYNIGTIPIGTTTVTFTVIIDTIPSINPIENMALTTYKYTVDPSIPNEKNDFIRTNIVSTKVNTVFLNASKIASKYYANVKDSIVYTIPIKNTGNISANNVILKETIPKGILYNVGSLQVIKETVVINSFNNIAYNVSTGALSIGLETVPIGTTTVTFSVLADTIPSLNPIMAKGILYYNYTVDPSLPNAYSNIANTNVESTRVSTVFLNASKVVNRLYADIGDTLEYTIPIVNSGNITANNVVLKDTIPEGVSFVKDSLFFNGIKKIGIDLSSGFNIGTLPVGLATVTYRLYVDTIPSINPMLNAATIIYNYTVDPTVSNEYSSSANTNITRTRINTVLLNTNKIVNKAFANIENTITYTIIMENTGSTTANNVIVQDTITEGTKFASDSLRVNNIQYPGATINDGFRLGTVPIGVTTITFDVYVDTVPSPNPIENIAFTSYNYTVDPSVPNQYSRVIKTDTAVTKVTAAMVNMDKQVDKAYADVGDTLTYSILIQNSGNTEVAEAVFKDTIPLDTTLIPNSLKLNNGVISANLTAGIDIGTLPVGSTTITFKVVVNTIPNINPIPNNASLKYKYTVDPSLPNEKDGGSNSNFVNTQVRTVFINSSKSVDKAYAKVGETLSYTVKLENTGNIVANNAVLLDTIPSGLSFVTNSLKVNGVTNTGGNPGVGFDLGTIPIGITTISYLIKVDTIPSSNPVYSSAVTRYDYIINPLTSYKKSSSTNTNVIGVKINNLFLNSIKRVDKVYANEGDTIMYTIDLINTGNVTANNVYIQDTVPQGTIFVDDSLAINGMLKPGLNPTGGVSLGTVPIGTTSLSFKIKVRGIPDINPVENVALIDYQYTVNPSIPNEYKERIATNIVATKVNYANLTGAYKLVDKPYATCNDIVTYKIVVPNTGNIGAKNLILADTIPLGTSYIPNSLKVNGIAIPGDPGNINVGSIEAGSVSIVEFKVKVNCILDNN